MQRMFYYNSKNSEKIIHSEDLLSKLEGPVRVGIYEKK